MTGPCLRTEAPAHEAIPVPAGARSEYGTTLLHAAAYRTTNPSVIKALIEAGANPAARDVDGKVPFDYAKENEVLKGTDAHWLLYEARFE